MSRTYLVECYAPGIEPQAVQEAAVRARAAAAELRDEGRQVEYVNGMLVCEDEIVFHLFTADDPGSVRDASVRAGVGFERILATIVTAVVALLLALSGIDAGAASASEPTVSAAKQKPKKPCRSRKGGRLYRTPGYRGVCKAPRTRPARPLPPVVLGPGRRPNVLVDAAGTAHIVWTQDGGDSPDLLRYCRLKRGATACDNPPATHAFFPEQPGEYNSPAFNEDFAGPRVVAIGDELALITHRYPNSVEKPDGGDVSRSTYMWVSDDGGSSFTGPGLVGNGEPTGGAAVFRTPSGDARIGLISDTRTGGTFFQAIAPGLYTGAQVNFGAGGPDRAYSGSLAAAGDRPIAAFSDLQNRTYIRQWSGAGDPNDPGQWSETATTGSEPRLASGPSGTFMVTGQTLGGPLQVRRLDGTAPGRATTVVPDGTSIRDFFQDAGGTLHLAWRGLDKLLMRSSRDGASFASSQTLAQPGFGFSDIDLGAAHDGGGFALYVGDGRTVAAVPFGNQGPTGRRGLGNLPGAGADPDTVSTCQEIAYGAVQILAQQGCLLQARGQAGVKVSEGPLRLNGLEIVPDANARVVLRTRGVKTIDSVGGAVTVQLPAADGPIVLFHGELHIELPSTSAGVKLATFEASKFKAVVKGFSVLGDIDVTLHQHSVAIPVSLKLPVAFGGITGEATLRADNARGLHLDSVHFEADTIPLGPLVLEDLEATWTGSTDTWSGGGRITMFGASLELHARFVGGAFREGSVRIRPVPFPGVVLFPDLFLNSVFGDLRLDDPKHIGAGAMVGVQPLAPPDVYVLGITAQLRATITPRFGIDVNGDGKLAIFPVFRANLHGDADGYFSASAEVRFDELEIITGRGGFEGFFDTARGQFAAKIQAEVCVGAGPTEVCGGPGLIVSSKGVAGCLGVIGMGYKWGGRPEVLGPPSCDLEDYEVAGRAATARAAQAAQSVTIPPGLPSASLRLTGQGGAAPSVVLVSPSGARLSPVPANAPGAATAPAVFIQSRNVTQVGLRGPAAGTWRVEPQPGSAVAEIAVANGLTPPKASARVGGRGRRRVLTYTATARPGLVVRFFETIGAGGREIGIAKGRRGRIRFTAGDGRGGRRAIIAIAEQNGLPRLRTQVASYRAPGPIRPRRVRGLRVRRSGRAVIARWRRSPGAASYLVRISISDGRRLARVVRGRRLRVGGISRGDRVRVSVAGRSGHGRLGRPVRGALRR